MSEAKFTKGKWKARVDDGAVKTALVYLDNKGGFDISGAPDCIANAHLIAAAPEMYEMLERFSKYFDEMCEGDVVNEISILLAKARGESV